MPTKRFCPYCGEPVISLSSMNIKLCSGCRRELPWKLSENKESIFGDRKAESKE